MNDILSDIVEVKKREVQLLKREYTLSRFSDFNFFDKVGLDFNKALSKNNTISIIAEVKKASPSKGIIRNDFNHITIANDYANNGASAISVLTDKEFFKGNISYLNDIAMNKSIPLLRKDFLIDEYQVFEAKANGADAILLISEILSANQIEELTTAAQELGMNVLLEMHSKEQISKIDFSKNKIIGINNRDLSNFKTEINTTKIISANLPPEIIIVSESGIKTKMDFDFLKTTSVRAVLIGEHFMTSEKIGNALKVMKDYC